MDQWGKVPMIVSMAREKKEETEPVRVRKSLVRRIARVAAHLDKSVPDYLAERLGPIIDADEAAMFDDLKRELGDKKRK